MHWEWEEEPNPEYSWRTSVMCKFVLFELFSCQIVFLGGCLFATFWNLFEMKKNKIKESERRNERYFGKHMEQGFILRFLWWIRVHCQEFIPIRLSRAERIQSDFFVVFSFEIKQWCLSKQQNQDSGKKMKTENWSKREREGEREDKQSSWHWSDCLNDGHNVWHLCRH